MLSNYTNVKKSVKIFNTFLLYLAISDLQNDECERDC